MEETKVEEQKSKDSEIEAVDSISKEETKDETLKKLIEWRDKYKKQLIKTDTIIEIKNEEDYEHTLYNFKLYARQLIISSKLQEVYILRQEEIVASIADARKRLEVFDNTPEEERALKFLNGELQEFNMLRVQTIPTLMIELETISPAIRANNDNLTEAGAETKYLIDELIDYLSHNANQ